MGLEALEMKVTCPFKTSGTNYQAMQCHISEYWNPYIHCCTGNM